MNAGTGIGLVPVVNLLWVNLRAFLRLKPWAFFLNAHEQALDIILDRAKLPKALASAAGVPKAFK